VKRASRQLLPFESRINCPLRVAASSDRNHCTKNLRWPTVFSDVSEEKIPVHQFRNTRTCRSTDHLLRHASPRNSCRVGQDAPPGDDLIPQPIGAVNHAITIRRSPHEVWSWLVQMGSGRAGWYAHDFIDNDGHHSAERILPEYQDISVGSVFPALPGATDVFIVTQCAPERSLVLSWRLPNGRYQTTWAFVLEQIQPDQTRLIVRGRIASGYRPYGLPQWLALSTGRLAHFIMQRKQLLGIARRAETHDLHR